MNFRVILDVIYISYNHILGPTCKDDQKFISYPIFYFSPADLARQIY